MSQFRFKRINFVISLSFSFTHLPCTRGKMKYNCEKKKSKFIHIHIYLNVKCILTCLNVLTPNISLTHKNNHNYLQCSHLWRHLKI